MPLETGTYISDLVPANPNHTDGLSQADSHLRLIKQILQNTFPNVNAPVTTSPTDLSHGHVPIGGIIMWSGTVASIPANWHLCDGNAGTPDLRAKFILGSDGDAGTYPPNATGGALVTDSQGAHNHGGSSASYVLLPADIPAHNHTASVIDPGHVHGFPITGGVLRALDNNAGGAGLGSGGNNTVLISATSSATSGISVTVANTGGNGGHAHGISSDGAHTHAVPLQPYYALAFIKRIS